MPSNRGQSSRSSSRSSSWSSSRGRSHNRCTGRHRSPTPHHINTITTTQDSRASNSNMQDKPSKPAKFSKCKNRSPTPMPSPLATFPMVSDTEDPDDTASVISIAIQSQEEDDLSTDYNAISPRSNYYIPMTPPKTCNATLPRPSTRNIQPPAQETEPTSNNSRKSTFPRPSTLNTNRFHQQPYIPRHHAPRFSNQWPPFLPRPPYIQKSFTPRPSPQLQGHQSPAHTTLHFIPQVSYIPVLLPHTNHVVTPVEYMYTA